MMKKITLFFFILLLFFVDIALAYHVNNHRDISKIATEHSTLASDKGDYLGNLGFKKNLEEVFLGKYVWKWITDGSEFEDNFPTYFNHFHNPLKPWPDAGLDDLSFSGQSFLLWAQESTNEFSWQNTRQYFYDALTSSFGESREASFAKTFEGLGHLIHLIQDAAQPAHVRNDAHPFDGLGWTEGMETWAKKEFNKILTYASSPVSPMVDLSVSIGIYEPITQFFDTDQYQGINPSTSTAMGLAEYTNANFASDDTIFTENFNTTDNHYFPFPRKADTEEYVEDIGGGKYRAYLRKIGNGETIEHFAAPGRLYRYLSFWPQIQRYFISLDDQCHKEYAQKLIPRAVGYSTGLLNYFFRGEMDMVHNSETGSYYEIVNNTEEDMDGAFELYYDNLNDERVQFWSEAFILGGISSGNNKSSNIDFTEPDDAKEPGKYMLVFKGKLGNETDVVVGKVIDPCEFYINIACNGITLTKPKTIKLVDAADTEYIKTSSEAEPNKFGPFSDIEFPATLYLFYKDVPVVPYETMFTFWTQCEADDPEVKHTKANEFSCTGMGNYVEFDISTGPGDFNVKEVKWKKGPTISTVTDQSMVFDFSDLKVLEKVKVHYKTWYPPWEYGCDPGPETKVVNEKSYSFFVLGRYPNDCSGNCFGEVCKTGDCQPTPNSPPNPYGTCLWCDYTKKIGVYNATKETMLILTDKDGNSPVFADIDIYIDAWVRAIGIGCCDGGGGADAYYAENFNIQSWKWYTFKMVNVPADRI